MFEASSEPRQELQDSDRHVMFRLVSRIAELETQLYGLHDDVAATDSCQTWERMGMASTATDGAKSSSIMPSWLQSVTRDLWLTLAPEPTDATSSMCAIR